MLRQNFPGAAIFPRKYGRPVKLERPDILGNFVAATIFPGDDISCDTGPPHMHRNDGEHVHKRGARSARTFRLYAAMYQQSLPIVESTEQGIPGASLKEPFDSHNVTALRWWLQCRGIKAPSSWRKNQLVAK